MKRRSRYTVYSVIFHLFTQWNNPNLAQTLICYHKKIKKKNNPVLNLPAGDAGKWWENKTGTKVANYTVVLQKSYHLTYIEENI